MYVRTANSKCFCCASNTDNGTAAGAAYDMLCRCDNSDIAVAATSQRDNGKSAP